MWGGKGGEGEGERDLGAGLGCLFSLINTCYFELYPPIKRPSSLNVHHHSSKPHTQDTFPNSKTTPTIQIKKQKTQVSPTRNGKEVGGEGIRACGGMRGGREGGRGRETGQQRPSSPLSQLPGPLNLKKVVREENKERPTPTPSLPPPLRSYGNSDSRNPCERPGMGIPQKRNACQRSAVPRSHNICFFVFVSACRVASAWHSCAPSRARSSIFRSFLTKDNRQ